MRVEMTLVVPAPHAENVRKRWLESGGSPDVVSSSNTAVQATFHVADRESTDGKLLDQLAAEIGATPAGPSFLSLSAVYDESDIAGAELLLLEIGGLEKALDPSTVESGTTCSLCGVALPPRLMSKPRLKGRAFQKLDLFNAEDIVFASQPLAERLANFKGAVVTEAETPEGAGAFFSIEASSSVGYPSASTWSAPCPKCGRRKGTIKGPYVVGMYTFPRSAWDGSDLVGTSLSSNHLIVTQGPWKVLSQPEWRVAENVAAARPVHLIDDVEPVR